MKRSGANRSGQDEEDEVLAVVRESKLLKRGELLEAVGRRQDCGGELASQAEHHQHQAAQLPCQYDLFKEQFKRYRPNNTKNKMVDFTDVTDFNKLNGSAVASEVTEVTAQLASEFGMLSPNKWEVFSDMKPGVIFIKNPFTPAGQRYWVERCLHDYPMKPNKTNLDRHYQVEDDDNVWQLRNSIDAKKNCLLRKLRWTTFGYHHNWDTKVYCLQDFSTFPKELGKLCEFITSQCSFDGYKAEAAIVNYYHMDSSIGGHTDHSEFDHLAPLISISFGQSAVFLLGGRTKQVKPSAMFLHSGDIIIMANESRLDYHGVPRIVRAPSNSWLDKDVSEVEDFKDFDDYLKSSRINVNVRQVYKR